MTTHHLKCWPPFFGPLSDGSKNFELRLDDRGFQKGDILFLHRTMEEDPDRIEMIPDPSAAAPPPTANTPPEQPPLVPAATLARRVTYCLHGPKFGLAPGWVIMALTPLEEESPQ